MVLDLNMPIVNGYEACTQLRKLYSEDDKIFRIKPKRRSTDQNCKSNRSSSSLLEKEERPFIVAVSAFVNADVLKDTKEAGFDLVIEGPFTFQKIDEVLSKINEI